MDGQPMKLAPDINPTMKQFWENTREPGEPFCRRCGIPEYATTDLRSFELGGQSFYLCYRCQKAVLSAVWPTETETPPAGEKEA